MPPNPNAIRNRRQCFLAWLCPVDFGLSVLGLAAFELAALDDVRLVDGDLLDVTFSSLALSGAR